MIELHASALLHDLRIIRQLLLVDDGTLYQTRGASLALSHTYKIIERIEDVQSFIEALEDRGPAEEVDLGEGVWLVDGGERCVPPASSPGPV